MRCPECNSANYQHELNFCPQCNNSISNPVSPHHQIEDPSSLPMVPRGVALAHPQNLNSGGEKASIQRLVQRLYREDEVLERGHPFWGILKHKRAYEAVEAGKATKDELVQIKQEAYIEFQRQIAGAELARNQAQISDGILHERLERIVSTILEILNLMNAETANLPEEVQSEIMITFYRGIAKNFLTIPSDNPSTHRIVLNSANDPYAIVDADEF